MIKYNTTIYFLVFILFACQQQVKYPYNTNNLSGLHIQSLKSSYFKNTEKLTLTFQDVDNINDVIKKLLSNSDIENITITCKDKTLKSCKNIEKNIKQHLNTQTHVKFGQQNIVEINYFTYKQAPINNCPVTEFSCSALNNFYKMIKTVN